MFGQGEPVKVFVASRPVDSMAETMREGAAVPVMEMSWSGREAETEWMPGGMLVGGRGVEVGGVGWEGYRRAGGGRRRRI